MAQAAGQAMVASAQANAIAGRGLAGDRYAEGRGNTWRGAPEIRHITLFSLADLADANAGIAPPLGPEEMRRNIAIDGAIRLLDLVGREFRVGAVALRGTEDCAPCRRLARLTGRPGLVKALIGKAGIRAEILSSGPIRVGDPVVT